MLSQDVWELLQEPGSGWHLPIFDGLCEDLDQAVLQKKDSDIYRGPGKAQAVLSACLLQMLGIWACPESSKMVWLGWFGGGGSWSREYGERLIALSDNSLAELD